MLETQKWFQYISKKNERDIMAMLDISRSSAYILIKKDFFRSHKIGNQIRISKVSFDEWLDGVSPTPRDI